MTPEEAIEILRHLSTAGAPRITLDEITATKLGIEALKRIQSQHLLPRVLSTELLPGEE